MTINQLFIINKNFHYFAAFGSILNREELEANGCRVFTDEEEFQQTVMTESGLDEDEFFPFEVNRSGQILDASDHPIRPKHETLEQEIINFEW